MKTNNFLFVLAAGFISMSAFAQTADEVVDKHIAALGGIEKINALKTITTERSLAVNGMDIPMKTVLVIGKSLRNESTVMGNTMVQVIDEGKGWMIRPTMMGGTGEPEDMPADQIKQQMGSLDPFAGLVNYKEKGSSIELAGKEKIDKKDVFHIKLKTADGQIVDEFIDANTFLLSRVKVSANGQDMSIDFSDYKDAEGVKMPYTMDLTNSQMSMTFSTSKVIVNGPVDNAIFKRTK